MCQFFRSHDCCHPEVRGYYCTLLGQKQLARAIICFTMNQQGQEGNLICLKISEFSADQSWTTIVDRQTVSVFFNEKYLLLTDPVSQVAPSKRALS